jgi:hypothetical protein
MGELVNSALGGEAVVGAASTVAGKPDATDITEDILVTTMPIADMPQWVTMPIALMPCAMVRLRDRFGDHVPGMPKPEINDGPARMMKGADGEFWGADEKGMWMYVIDCLSEAKAPFVVGFKTFLHEWTEQTLTGGGA